MQTRRRRRSSAGVPRERARRGQSRETTTRCRAARRYLRAYRAPRHTLQHGASGSSPSPAFFKDEGCRAMIGGKVLTISGCCNICSILLFLISIPENWILYVLVIPSLAFRSEHRLRLGLDCRPAGHWHSFMAAPRLDGGGLPAP